MIRGTLTIATFLSVIVFPWPLTALLAVISSIYVPLVPLAVGIFADTLYYTPQTNILPLFTIFGATISCLAVFVHSQLRTSIIR